MIVAAVLAVGCVVCGVSVLLMPKTTGTPGPTRTPRPTRTPDPTEAPTATRTPAPTRAPRATATPTPDVADQFDAYAMCKQFVSDRLKAPASAKWPTVNDARIAPEGEDWIVASYVDAQNTFGALLRSDYTCRVRYLGADKWELVDLVIE